MEKLAELVVDLLACKEGVWEQSLLVPGYPGARDANDRCITGNTEIPIVTIDLTKARMHL